MEQQGKKQVDVVIAWVDGDSPILKQKRERYKKTEDMASGAVSSTRFASNNEIYYNIASILKYVPFCRHIYVVTDQQQPEFINNFFKEGLCPKDRIRIVDHKEIFAGYEQFLPTFNTRSIETMLWNIPELSDYFVYMNDDFFFNQPAKIQDFLDNESIIIHGHWRKNSAIKAKLKYRKSLQKILGTVVQPKHTTAQMLSAQILNMNQFFEIHHYPHIVDKTLLKNYLLSNVHLLSEQIRYKFRDVAQFNPITLTNHLKIQKKEACLKPPTTINYLKNRSGVENFITDLQKDEVRYGCIQSLDLLDSDSYQRITNAMMQKFSAHLPSLL